MHLSVTAHDARCSAIRTTLLLAGAAVLAILAPIPAGAQPQSSTDAKPAPSEQQLIAATYALTKNASTAEDYTKLIKSAEQAKAAKLSSANAAYIEKLLGWAHNRRGEAYAERASNAARQGQSAETEKLDAQALADFDAAVKHDPDSWKARHNRGVSLAQAGQFQKALADFQRALEVKSDYANAWFNRGAVLYQLGKYEDAISDFNRALQLDPRDAGTYTHRGHARFQLKQFRDALADYNQAVAINSRSAEAYANRGDAYLSMGQWQLAANDYRQAIALDDKLARAYQSAAWLMATSPDERYQDSVRAVQAAERAIQLEPDPNFKYLDTLAAAYASAGQFDQAQEALSKAIVAAPEDEKPRLEDRMKLYENSQPYRQSGN